MFAENDPRIIGDGLTLQETALFDGTTTPGAGKPRMSGAWHLRRDASYWRGEVGDIFGDRMLAADRSDAALAGLACFGHSIIARIKVFTFLSVSWAAKLWDPLT